MQGATRRSGWNSKASTRALVPLLLAPMIWTLTLGLACATGPLSRESGDSPGFRHRELGYRIDDPEVLRDPGWEQASLEDSDLVVRHPDGSAWALASNCRSTGATARVLARELARATGAQPVAPGAPLRHADLEGWTQRLERKAEEVGAPATLWIETVTLRGRRCTYDWILLAPTAARFAELEPGFERWWRSFVPGPEERIEAPAESAPALPHGEGAS